MGDPERPLSRFTFQLLGANKSMNSIPPPSIILWCSSKLETNGEKSKLNRGTAVAGKCFNHDSAQYTWSSCWWPLHHQSSFIYRNLQDLQGTAWRLEGGAYVQSRKDRQEGLTGWCFTTRRVTGHIYTLTASVSKEQVTPVETKQGRHLLDGSPKMKRDDTQLANI